MKKLFVIALVLVGALAAGVAVHWSDSHATQDHPAQANDTGEIKQLWTCGMHPQVIREHPGICPICHMKLTRMRQADSSSTHEGSPTVVIDPVVVQNMGIRTAEVTRGPIVKSVQTVGVLEAPATGLYDISPKVGGWIEKLYANQDGQHVHKGEPLFDLYSPDLLVAEQELIGAVKSSQALGSTADASLKKSSESLVESARQKLRLLDVSDEDINAIAGKSVATKTITFRSPVSGAVIDKAIVDGSAIQPGQKLMRIEDHSSLWLQLQVYEEQMAVVAVGQDVRATVEAFPGKVFTGRITFVHPHVDHMSRTVNARAVLTNPDFTLRPGMYAAAVILTLPVEDAVQAPRESVIDTGTHQIVFVAEAEGRFTPRTVHMGLLGDRGLVQILDGLSPGETVVTSGEFLLDVESRTTEAINKLRSAIPDEAVNSTNVSNNTMPTMALATTIPASEPPASSTRPDAAIVPAATVPALAGPVSPIATCENLTVAYCPMKKAHWLQHGLKIANPYFGSQMLNCGDVQQTLTVPDTSSPIPATISAYVRFEEGLATDKLDKQAQTTLKAAAQALTQPEFARLRSASLAVASAPDIAAARVLLETLSETLLPAVRDLPAARSAPASMPSSVGGRP